MAGTAYSYAPAALPEAATDLTSLQASLAQAVSVFQATALGVAGAFAGQPGPEATYRRATGQVAGQLEQLTALLGGAADALRANQAAYQQAEDGAATTFDDQGKGL